MPPRRTSGFKTPFKKPGSAASLPSSSVSSSGLDEENVTRDVIEISSDGEGHGDDRTVVGSGRMQPPQRTPSATSLPDVLPSCGFR